MSKTSGTPTAKASSGQGGSGPKADTVLGRKLQPAVASAADLRPMKLALKAVKEADDARDASGDEAVDVAAPEKIAMVDQAAQGAVTLASEPADAAGQTAAASAAPAAAASSAGGIGAMPLVLGGLAVVGGGLALAGGGKKDTAPTPPVTPPATPVNGAPVVAATQAVSVAEDAKATITVSATDPNGDTLSYTNTAPSKGSVTASGNSFVYTPNANFNGTDSFTVTVNDGKGGTVTQTVNITVTPVNDGPVAAADTGAATEDAAALTGSVATNDSDLDGDTLTYALAAPVAGLTLNSNGSYSFNPADAAYQNLAAGQVRDVVANYSVSDGKGGTATSTLTIKVTGVNDAPSVAAAQSVAANEDAASVAFTVAATDVDQGDALVYLVPSQSAKGGAVTAGTGGTFTYVPLPDFNGTDSVVVTVTDRAGAQSTQTVTFNVASNLAETLSIDVSNDSQATTYDAAGSGFTAGDNFKFTDDPARATNARIVNFTRGDTIEVAGNADGYSFSSVGTDLVISFNNTSAGVLNQIVIPGVATGFIRDEASAESVLGHDFFRATTNSAGGGTGTAAAGGNLDLDNDSNVSTTALTSAAGSDIAYTENADVANAIRITDFARGDTITVSNATANTYSFTSIGNDLVITANKAGIASSIAIAGVVPTGAFVNNEASAEAALGFDFFRFASSGGSGGGSGGQGTAQSIDNGATVSTINAGTAALNFTDDATKETNVVITNFTANDRISVSGATLAQYSFTNTDPNDLVITAPTGNGGVNSIVLDDVLVGKNVFIFDYATARQAVGFDFMVFG